MARRKCPPGCKCGRHAHVLRTSYEKTCAECGQTFTAKRIDARFCTGDCHRRFYDRENKDRQREVHARWVRENRASRREIERRYEAKHGDRVRAEKREHYAEVSADPDEAAARQAKKRQYYQDNRERILAQKKEKAQEGLASRYRWTHGTDWETLFEALWEAQGGKCYLCGDDLKRDVPKAIHLDHDHACCPLAKTCERCRRGLACKDCNRLIGVALDDPDRLHRIADNLARAKDEVRERMQQPRKPRAENSWELTCQFCGIAFRGCRSDIKCCSSACYCKLNRRDRAESLNNGAGTTPCKWCGTMFVPRTVQNVYCSKDCSNHAYVERKR